MTPVTISPSERFYVAIRMLATRANHGIKPLLHQSRHADAFAERTIQIAATARFIRARPSASVTRGQPKLMRTCRPRGEPKKAPSLRPTP